MIGCPALAIAARSPRALRVALFSTSAKMLTTRRVLKILHELGSSGMIGALAAHAALLGAASATDAVPYATLRRGIDLVATNVLMPSLAIVLVTGVLAMAVHPPFHDAGWVWIKALLGVSVFEATLGGIQGPSRRAAEIAVRIVAGDGDPSALHTELRHEWVRLGILLFLTLVNVVVSVWRPKLRARRPAKPERAPRLEAAAAPAAEPEPE